MIHTERLRYVRFAESAPSTRSARRERPPQVRWAEHLRRPSHHLEGLGQLAREIDVAESLLSAYRSVWAFAEAMTAASGIFIGLRDPVRNERLCLYSAGQGVEDDPATFPPMPMNGSPQSRAISTGLPILVNDLQPIITRGPVITVGLDRDPRPPLSALVIPLQLHGRVVGALELQSVHVGAFSRRDVALFQVVGSFLAAAMGQFESPAMRGTRRRRAHTREQLRSIIKRRAFATVYQPILDLRQMRPVGYEALTRFEDDVPPDRRFAGAEAVGMGADLDIAALEVALAAAEDLPADAWLSVNVSPRVLVADERLRQLMRSWNRPIVLEVTEHAPITDYDVIRARIAELGPLVRLAVDDAGSGYASIRHVIELTPAFLKIDRTIIEDVDRDPARQAMLAGLVEFARRMGTTLIAEGIERQAEADTLVDLGVLFGQGYLLGRPAPSASIPSKPALEKSHPARS